jgi:ubiquinone/menaquinone biosynthesis C-methylase UbiE
MGFDMRWRPCQCHFGQGAYDKAKTAISDRECAKTQRFQLGKQTAIHEQVLNTESTDELMDLYEDWAAVYDRDVNDTWGYSGPDRTLFWLRRYLEPEGALVLDAGCGTGLVGVALSQGGYKHINGIDYSKAMLAEAAKKNVYQQLQQMNMNVALPIDAGAYDGVTCVGTFTSAHVVPEALRELVRITRSGGIVCCTVREEYWQETHFPEVLNQIVESGGAALKQLCDEPYVHSEESTCKMVVLEVTPAA